MTMKKRPLIKMRAGRIFYETGRYILSNPLFILCVFVVNMVYMLLLKAIPRGIQNLLFVVWIVTYYVFWCFFYRYYYRLKPYFLRSAILGSLTPSTLQQKHCFCWHCVCSGWRCYRCCRCF